MVPYKVRLKSPVLTSQYLSGLGKLAPVFELQPDVHPCGGWQPTPTLDRLNAQSRIRTVEFITGSRRRHDL